jgi:drug/metabolite transporter (DMT)-like permease
MQKHKSMAAADWGQLALLSLLFAGVFLLVRVIVQEVPPLTLVSSRFMIAALALWLFIRAARISVPTSWSHWVAYAGMGLLNNLLPSVLLAWSQKAVTAGLAAILIATTPIFSIVIAHYLTPDEKITTNKLTGVALGIAGVVMIVGPDSLNGSQQSTLAILGCLGAALLLGSAIVFGRRFAKMDIAPVVGAFGQTATTGILVLPFALVLERPWRLPIPHADVFASILGLSLLSTSLAYVIFFRILARAGATNVGVVSFLTPVSAVILGWLVLNEQLHASQFAGMALITLGLIAIDGRPRMIGWRRAKTDQWPD